MSFDSFPMLEEEKLVKRGDYTLWKMRIHDYLDIFGLMEALKINEDDDENSDGTAAVLSPGLEEKNRKARSMIIISVGDKFLRKIMKEETASGMLQILDKFCMNTSLLRRLYLIKKLSSFRMNESCSVMENISEFQKLIDELRNAEVFISDKDQAKCLLMSLPKQFDEVRYTLTYGDKPSLTLDEVTDAALFKELELGEGYRGYRNKRKEKSEIRVDKFDGSGDYTLWKTKILAHIEIIALMEGLEIEEKEDGNKSVGTGECKSLEEKKRVARRMIIESVEDKELRKKILKENKVADMSQVLDKLYSSSTDKVYLQNKLCRFRMNESESVEANIDEFERLVDDLSNAKVFISDEDQARLLLMSLPKQFDQLRDTLMSRTSLTLDEVICAVLSKDLDFGSVSQGY